MSPALAYDWPCPQCGETARLPIIGGTDADGAPVATLDPAAALDHLKDKHGIELVDGEWQQTGDKR